MSYNLSDYKPDDHIVIFLSSIDDLNNSQEKQLARLDIILCADYSVNGKLIDTGPTNHHKLSLQEFSQLFVAGLICNYIYFSAVCHFKLHPSDLFEHKIFGCHGYGFECTNPFEPDFRLKVHLKETYSSNYIETVYLNYLSNFEESPTIH